MIDASGNKNEAENDDGNDAENEDENEHDDLDEDQNEHEDLEEAPTNNYSTDEEPNNATDPDTMSNTMDKQYGARTQMNMMTEKRCSRITTMQRTPTPCRTPWTNNMVHKNKRTYGLRYEKVTFPRSYAYTRQSTANVQKFCTPTPW